MMANFLISRVISAFQEGFRSMELLAEFVIAVFVFVVAPVKP
jgi:hypothetical protein